MVRSRDLHRRHWLDIRDTVQVWVLSLLVEAPLLAVLLFLSPLVKTIREGIEGMAFILGALITTDLLTVLLLIIWKVAREHPW